MSGERRRRRRPCGHTQVGALPAAGPHSDLIDNEYLPAGLPLYMGRLTALEPGVGGDGTRTGHPEESTRSAPIGGFRIFGVFAYFLAGLAWSGVGYVLHNWIPGKADGMT